MTTIGKTSAATHGTTMSEQSTSGLDPATATRAALSEWRERITETLAKADLFWVEDVWQKPIPAEVERITDAVMTVVTPLLARVAELEAQRAAVLALCDQAERHAGTARFGYLNEDDVRAALTAASDTGGTR